MTRFDGMHEVTTVQLIGEAQGHLWWPSDVLASIPMDATIARDGRTLADIVEGELDARSGDFRDAARLSEDAVIVVSRVRWDGSREYVRRRHYLAADVPSLRGLVGPAPARPAGWTNRVQDGVR